MKKQLLRMQNLPTIAAITSLCGITILAIVMIVMMTSPARQLTTAIRQGDSDEVRRLVAGRTNLAPIRLPGGLCPLSFAIKENKPDCFSTLLEGGTDPNTRNRDGTAPIHHASAADSSVFIEYLLSHGADPDLEVVGRHPCEHPLSWAIYTGRVDNARL
jgi:uncharacterized protein